jgi:adenosylcobinamide-GDP ribazoletransferase
MIVDEARYFLIALQFLTRLRIRRIDPFPTDWLPRSAKYMPLVGALIGAVVGGVIYVAAFVLPSAIPILIGLAASMLLTGALHEDGLADTFDALGGGRTPERCLEIMKDSRVGTYGVLALITTFALKAAALSATAPGALFGLVIVAYAGARLAAVIVLAFLPYAGGDNVKVSRTPVDMTRSDIVVASATALIIGLCFMPIVPFVIAALSAFAAAGFLAWIAHRKIGGYTGDVLGAVEQIYETAFIAVAAALLAPHLP